LLPPKYNVNAESSPAATGPPDDVAFDLRTE
jgi:hypothetical protein